MSPAINSQVLTGTNPCINKVIRMLLIYDFVVLHINILGPSQNLTSSSVTCTVVNKNKKESSFKSNENIHEKENRSYYVVLANKASSVTL